MRRAVIAAAVLAAGLLAAPPALAGPMDALSRAGSRIWNQLVDFVASGVQVVVGIIALIVILQFVTRLLMGGMFRRW